MIEEKILRTIGDRTEDERLHFQAIVQDKTLHIYMNRDTDEYIDHSQLTDTIKTAIAELQELDLLAVELYSRMLGEVEPDWQTSIELVDPEVVAEDLKAIASDVKQEVAETKSLVKQIEQEIEIDASSLEIQPNTNPKAKLTAESAAESEDRETQTEEKTVKAEESRTGDFGQYCFIRNKGLIKADLVPPQTKIAQLLDVFAKFEVSQQRSQLPLLVEYFKNLQEPDLSDVTPEIQNWWTEAIALDGDPKRKFAIWLSRYCFDPESTMAAIDKALALHVATTKASEKQAIKKAREERESRDRAYLKALNRPAPSPSESLSFDNPKSVVNYCVTCAIFLLIVKFAAIPAYRHLDTPVAIDTRETTSQSAISDSQTDVLQRVAKANNLMNSGMRKYQNRNLEGALADLTEAIAIFPESHSNPRILANAYDRRGLVLQKIGKYQEALADANRSVELVSERGEYYAHRALAHLELNDFYRAIEDQTRAIELKPNQPDLYFNRGKTHYAARNHEQALADLDRVIALNSFYVYAYEQRYFVHRAMGNWQKAQADYEKAKYLGYEPQE